MRNLEKKATGFLVFSPLRFLLRLQHSICLNEQKFTIFEGCSPFCQISFMRSVTSLPTELMTYELHRVQLRPIKNEFKTYMHTIFWMSRDVHQNCMLVSYRAPCAVGNRISKKMRIKKTITTKVTRGFGHKNQESLQRG